MPTTNHMPASVKARIDTDVVQPDNSLNCTSRCPSFVGGKCLVCGWHKTPVEEGEGKSYVRTDYCVPVFDEIRRLYGEDQASRKRNGDSKHRFVECAVVYKALNDDFDKEVTQLLTEGWQRDGRFQVETGGGTVCGVQMMTRTSYVVKEDTDCDHDFVPESTGRYVCSTCDCYGVRLSEDQRWQLGDDTPLVIPTSYYEEKLLPS
jgi:hypothetical protein